MQDYLVERELLKEVVDRLIKDGAAKGRADLSEKREELIGELDKQITDVIFDNLSDEQSIEINKILNDDDASEDAFKDFFDKNQIDLVKIIRLTIDKFVNEKLGGEDAE